MAKNNPKEHTRERIINSAKKLFAEQGYQKTTIKDRSYCLFEDLESEFSLMVDAFKAHKSSELETTDFLTQGRAGVLMRNK